MSSLENHILALGWGIRILEWGKRPPIRLSKFHLTGIVICNFESKMCLYLVLNINSIIIYRNTFSNSTYFKNNFYLKVTFERLCLTYKHRHLGSITILFWGRYFFFYIFM
jgi:hypothetical protein